MEEDLSLADELTPWLKSDLLGTFGDLLDDGEDLKALRGRDAVTLGSEDLLLDDDTLSKESPVSRGSLEYPHQEMPSHWIRHSLAQHQSMQSLETSQCQPFPGFPSAGGMSMPIAPKYESTPLSCFRTPEDDSSMPNSWDSNLSSYSLQDCLVATDLTSIPETRQTKLRSRDSFACSYDKFSLDEENNPRSPVQTKKSKSTPKVEGSVAKASLADRNRERQQRFRQRQKAKIETLENQVVKLTQQTQTLISEKADLSSRATKLTELLQDKDHIVSAMLSNKMPQAQASSPLASFESDADVPQLSLTYCNPPLVFTKSQLAKLDALDLTKVWKEYVWSFQNLLKNVSSLAQWTTEAERLDALTSELVHLVMHLWDSCPDFSGIKVSGFTEDSHRRDESEDENWQRIAHQIVLSPDQLAALSHLRNTMRLRMQTICGARREAQVSLAACYEEIAITSKDLHMQHQRVKVINDALSNGLKEENLLARDFEFAFYKKVLRPEQRAICIVQAYPRFPDCQALANWMAACHGDIEARSMMTNHASSSATSFHSS